MNPSTRSIEKIVGSNDSRGKLEYLIKWQGQEECDLIEAEEAYAMYPQFFLKFFEENLTLHDDSSAVTNRVKRSRPQKKDNKPDIPDHIDSKIVEKVIGATKATGPLMFLVKLRDIEECQFMVAKEAYLRCPKLVLKWYHDKIYLN